MKVNQTELKTGGKFEPQSRTDHPLSCGQYFAAKRYTVAGFFTIVATEKEDMFPFHCCRR
jgi:hypothetical protein